MSGGKIRVNEAINWLDEHLELNSKNELLNTYHINREDFGEEAVTELDNQKGAILRAEFMIKVIEKMQARIHEVLPKALHKAERAKLWRRVPPVSG